MKFIQLTNSHKTYLLWCFFIVMILVNFNTLAMQSANVQNNKTFNVEVIGQDSPVILIPGLMSNGSIWQVVANKLSKTHQVHIISVAGFAGTPKVDNFALHRLKQELLTYINHNKLAKPIIIGHSLGGFMSFWLASSSPESIGNIISVDGLPFIAPIFTRTNDSTVESMASQAQYIRNMYINMTPEQLASQTQQGIYIQATSESAQKRIVNMALLSDPTTVGESIYEIMSTDLRPELKHIKSKILLIGASGAFTQTSQQQQVEVLYKQQLEGLTNAKLVMNTQDRHFIMLDNEQWLLDQIQHFIGNEH